MKPKVSIIIPTYNQERYIAKAIDSALVQDYENLEIVLSDDNSKDNTQQIIKKYLKDKRFKYFRNQKNLGRVKNYHKALYDYATGDYALVLDGDDYLTDNSYIRKAIDLIIKNKLIIVFAKQKVLIERNKKVIEDKMNDNLPKIIDGNWLFLNYPKGYSIPHLTTLYDRRYAMKIGYYTEDILSSDWESFLRIILNNKIGFIKESIGVWRKHASNSSRSKALKEILTNIKYLEEPYIFCIRNNIFEKERIEYWRNQMLRRYFVKNLLKLLIIKDIKRFDELSLLFKKYNKKVYNLVTRDPKFILMRIIVKNKVLTSFIFKKILKIESFSEDL